jgi:zinc protease
MRSRTDIAPLPAFKPWAFHFFMILMLITGFFMSLSSAATAKPAPFEFGSNVQSFKLENGMQVVVIPDLRAPVVTHMVWYNVGAADEPEGVSGIAHFLEHLMFKGTQKFPGSTFSDTVARVGGTENAFTSQDYTAYFQRVAKEHLPALMEMEADRMSNLVLSDEVVIPERDVVQEERRSRTDNNPSARLGEKMARVFNPAHPYGIPIIGWPDEISKLSKEDAIAFYDRFYTPSNAILIVAGDVEANEVLALAQTTYGKVAERAVVPKRNRPQNPVRHEQEKVELVSEQVGLESLRLSFPVPSYATASGNEGAALDVLSQLMGGGVTSYLYQDLVVKTKVASNVGVYYQGSSYDASELMIYATPADGVTLEALEAAIMASVDAFKAADLPETDLQRAKTQLVAEAIYAQDNQSSLARIYGVALTTGQSIEDVQSWPRDIKAVTETDVRAVANRYLQVQSSVLGLLRKPAS